MSVYVGLSGKAIQVQVDRKQMFRALKRRVPNASSRKEGKKREKRVEGVGLKNKIIKCGASRLPCTFVRWETGGQESEVMVSRKSS